MIFLLLLFQLVVVASSSGGANFGYNRYDGPATWKGECRSGRQQSPIDINIGNLKYEKLGPLRFRNYDARGKVKIENNGHTEEVKGFDAWRRVPEVSGGGLRYTYRLAQYHLHWNGDAYSGGSEHTFMGIHAPLELHLVHYRSDMTFEKAKKRKDGLAVVSILFTVGSNPDPLTDIERFFPKTIKARTEAEDENYSPRNLIPRDVSHFLRYEGSLTTPPCSEVVTWTILTAPFRVHENQLNQLRQRVASDGTRLRQNWRFTMPLNYRPVIFSGYSSKSSSQNSHKKGLNNMKPLIAKCSRRRSSCPAALNQALSLLSY